MAVTGNVYVADVDITNYLSAQLREALTENNSGFEQLHLDNAESMVNSYLARRFLLPIVNPSLTPALRDCTLALFHEKIELVTRALHADTGVSADKCRTWLQAVADGELALENEDEQIHQDAGAVGDSNMEFEDRIFTDGREDESSNTTRDRIGINPSFTGIGTTRV